MLNVEASLKVCNKGFGWMDRTRSECVRGTVQDGLETRKEVMPKGELPKRLYLTSVFKVKIIITCTYSCVSKPKPHQH